MRPRLLLGFLLLMGAVSAVQAGPWQVCRMQVEIVAKLKKPPYPALQARVLQVEPKRAAMECPAAGDVISFVPESVDYQSTLPFKRWPRPGQTIRMRYLYLDGICKRESVPDSPCRIKHYPIDGLEPDQHARQ